MGRKRIEDKATHYRQRYGWMLTELEDGSMTYKEAAAKYGVTGWWMSLIARTAGVIAKKSASRPRMGPKVDLTKRNAKILKLWNSGKHTMTEVGLITATNKNIVAWVLERSRQAGVSVRSVRPTTRTKR